MKFQRKTLKLFSHETWYFIFRLVIFPLTGMLKEELVFFVNCTFWYSFEFTDRISFKFMYRFTNLQIVRKFLWLDTIASIDPLTLRIVKMYSTLFIWIQMALSAHTFILFLYVSSLLLNLILYSFLFKFLDQIKFNKIFNDWNFSRKKDETVH